MYGKSMESIGIHSTQMTGLINALRTGDPTVDMTAAFVLPLIATQLLSYLPPLKTKVIQLIFGPKRRKIVEYHRDIICRMTSSFNGGQSETDSQAMNMYLIRAMHLYIHRHCKLGELHGATVDFTILDTQKCEQRRKALYINTMGTRSTSPSTIDLLQSCSILEKPPQEKWLDAGKHGEGQVYVMILDSENQGTGDGGDSDKTKGGGHVVRTQRVSIKSETSVDCIHAFIKAAVDFYVNELRAEENKDRFMFDIVRNDRGGPGESRLPSYVSHKLGSGKTFQNLFSRKCHQLLPIVDHFQNKTGKYAISGYPHKLGLLLHGPPGSGKTSLIKALAHYTGRHIVNVNLANISTNTELRNIVFNKTYQIASGDGQIHFKRLDFNQVIFVFEDVDAGAKNVVMDRTMLAKFEKEEATKKKKEEEEKTPKLNYYDYHRNGGGKDEKDKLNLSGLLNVLDGVVETPGRMVIMTTNCPDILDAALIRPGRIDKILELGYMDNGEDVVNMIEHYYPDRQLTEDERQMVTGCLLQEGKVKMKVTPAQMEQLAMEEENLTGFLRRFSDFQNRNDAAKNLPNSLLKQSNMLPISTSSGSNSTLSSTDLGGDDDGDDDL